MSSQNLYISLCNLIETPAASTLFAIAGGDDLGMLEIQDAARVITESIDPHAKVIFGAIRDDKLKKNEVKVTVIATGFPEVDPSSIQSPLMRVVHFPTSISQLKSLIFLTS